MKIKRKVLRRLRKKYQKMYFRAEDTAEKRKKAGDIDAFIACKSRAIVCELIARDLHYLLEMN